MNRLSTIALGFGALVAAASTTAAPAHQHGVAALQVAVDGKRLEIQFESPLDNLLGFEHAPRTEAQRQAVRSMKQRFEAAATLFVPNAEARCTAAGTELKAAILQPGGAKAGEHDDLDATLRFECADALALRSIDLAPLFKAFPGLRRIDAAVASPRGQRGAVLNPKQPRLSW